MLACADLGLICIPTLLAAALTALVGWIMGGKKCAQHHDDTTTNPQPEETP